MAKSERKSNQVDLLGVYQYLSRELQQARDALLMEVRMSSAQIGSLHGDLRDASDKASSAVAQEIRFSYKQNQTIYDGLAAMLTNEVGERLNSMEGMLTALEKLQILIDDLNEMKYNYMNMQAVCDTTQALVANEINPKLDAVGTILANDVNPKVDTLSAVIASEVSPKLDAISSFVASDVSPKLDSINSKQVLLDEIQAIVSEINNKITEPRDEEDYAKLIDAVAVKTDECVAQHSRQVVEAIAALPAAENVDYNRIVEEVGDKVLELLHQIKGEEPAPVLPVEMKIDYDRIICGAAEKVVESLPQVEKIDYSRLERAIAENTVAAQQETFAQTYAATMDAEPTIDAEALAESVASKLTAPEVNYDTLADLVASRIVIPAPVAPQIDYERLADMVAAKIAVPAAPEVDYDRLSDLVIAKMTAGAEQTCEVVLDEAGIEEIATKVVDKMPTVEAIDYDKVCQAAQAAQILPDVVDYDRIAEIVEDKLSSDEPAYDLLIDEDGIAAIAKGVSKELATLQVINVVAEETPVEEALAEEIIEEAVIEEPVAEEIIEEVAIKEPVAEEIIEEVAIEEPVAEEIIEEVAIEEPVAEEIIEEVVIEEPVAEEVIEEVASAAEETPVEEVAATPVTEEIAAAEMAAIYQEVGNDLVDAETGLIIRLKRSFTAKMKQSEDKVKEYYSDLKNELVSYKKINSNVSWHGDRFNFGRDTVAKINICGKTLCFYIALDPNDPEYKTTVYHQKDVGAQKAYESTPFMVKVKSDAAEKKALRLVGYLAEKLGTEKEENFEPVDYAGEFAYASTKQLFDEGLIKATKEKKVDLNF